MTKILRYLSVTGLASLNLVLVVAIYAVTKQYWNSTATAPEAAFVLMLGTGILGLSSLLIWLISRRLDTLMPSSSRTKRHSLSLTALANANDLHQALLNSLDEAIFATDLNGDILEFNAQAQSLFGLDRHEVLARRNIGEIVGADWRLAKSEIPLPKTAYNKTGEAFRMEFSTKEFQLESSRIFVVVIRDTTKSHNVQLELARHRDRLEDLVKQRTVDLARARDQAMEASRAKSAFLANMSHELRTPLNAIIGYSEIMAEEASEAGHTQYLEDLNRVRMSGRHLLELINDVLDLSKIESGKMELHLSNFDLRHLCESVLNSIEPLMQKNRNKVIRDFRGNLGQMDADITKVRQIILNLASNAAKFTEEGEITISVERTSRFEMDWITLSVTDTGIGIEPYKLAKLFEDFSQGDSSSTRRYGGTGLGLSITRRFCEMMGGQISATSEPGKGSTFTVQLPAAIIGPKVDPREIRFAPDPSGIHERRKKISRVLVIDDDPFARDLLERFLTREGFYADTAPNAQRGLNMARENPPDIIVLDVKMPGSDGWTALSQLKTEADLHQIPVIMLTKTDDREFNMALGASDFLPKPVERKRLLDLLCRHVRDPDRAQQIHALVVEDDPVNRDLLRSALEREGLSVSIAEHGLAALDKMSVQTPDLIFLDLMMPIMDGFKFLERMRKRPEWAKIPVVTLTAIDLTVEQRDLLNGQVEIILDKKTFGPVELLQELRALIVHMVRDPHRLSHATMTANPPQNAERIALNSLDSESEHARGS